VGAIRAARCWVRSFPGRVQEGASRNMLSGKVRETSSISNNYTTTTSTAPPIAPCNTNCLTNSSLPSSELSFHKFHQRELRERVNTCCSSRICLCFEHFFAIQNGNSGYLFLTLSQNIHTHYLQGCYHYSNPSINHVASRNSRGRPSASTPMAGFTVEPYHVLWNLQGDSIQGSACRPSKLLTFTSNLS